MKTKEEIVNNWLPRYTGKKLEDFGKYILLTNFIGYVNMFAEWQKVEVEGLNRPMQTATSEGMTIINFSMGSPMAATIMDLLIADTELTVIKIWSEYKYNSCSEFILNSYENQAFDHYFLCKPDIPWEPDPLRENENERDELFQLYLAELKVFTKDKSNGH